VPCFTGAVGNRAGPDVTGGAVGGVDVTVAGVGGGVAVAVATGVFAVTRTGAHGPVGVAPRAASGTTTTCAPLGGGVCAGATAASAGWGYVGASTQARGAGRVMRRRMARTDHTGRVRRSMGRASRAIATTRRRELAAKSSGNKRGTPASLTERLSRSGRHPNRPPGAAESPSPWANTVRWPSASLAHFASSPRVPPSQASTLHESIMALAPNSP